MNDREISLKFKEFVEILNAIDEILLGDNSVNKHRRSWNDTKNLSKPINSVDTTSVSDKYNKTSTTRELMMWAVLSLREDKLEQIISNLVKRIL